MSKTNFVVTLQQVTSQNVFVEADSIEEAEALAVKGEGDGGSTMVDDWKVFRTVERPTDARHCAYCGKPTTSDATINRDGWDKGPEVTLCLSCAEDTSLTNDQIWERIGQL